MPAPREALFQYHARPGAFERLVPPGSVIRVLLSEGGIQDGGRLIFKMRQGPIPIKWEAHHENYIPGQQFCDRQVKGPFSSWFHVHRFLDAPNDQSMLCDQVDWSLPPGGLIDGFAVGPMEKMLEKMFRVRHQRTHDDLWRHQQQPEKFTVLLAGRITPLTRALSAFLSTGGHRVYILERRGQRHIMRDWLGDTPCHPLDEVDAVIHSGPKIEPNPDLAYLDFLKTALKTMDHQPDLWLNLRIKRPVMGGYTDDPGIDFSHRKPKVDPRELMENALEQLEPFFTRTVNMFPGSLIRGPFSYLTELLLRLETYLFLKESARTLSFHWLAMDDAVGAIHFILGQRDLSGGFTVAGPQLGTRAELQESLIKEDFMAYTGNRILKVLPWSTSGSSTGLEPELQSLPTLQSRGFRPLAQTLSEAVRRELGA